MTPEEWADQHALDCHWRVWYPSRSRWRYFKTKPKRTRRMGVLVPALTRGQWAKYDEDTRKPKRKRRRRR